MASASGLSIDLTMPDFEIVLSDKEIKSALYAAAQSLAKEMQGELAHSVAGTREDPSKPGQAPARRTGKLAKKVRAKKTKSGAVVQDAVAYAAALEVGANRGSHGGVLQARPYFTAALAAHQGEIVRRLEQAMKTGVTFKETT